MGFSKIDVPPFRASPVLQLAAASVCERERMINPAPNDIGRGVVCYAKQGDNLMPAYGTVIGFDQQQVFVTYGDSDPIPALREDLYWTEPEMTRLAPSDDDRGVTDDLTLALPFSDQLTAQPLAVCDMIVPLLRRFAAFPRRNETAELRLHLYRICERLIC